MTIEQAAQKKILILSANPQDTTRLRVDKEIRDIKQALERAKYRDKYTIETAQAVQVRDLQRAILDKRPNFIHFSGHGEGEKGLIFEDEIGQKKFVQALALANFFKLFSERIECIILNACYSEVQVQTIAEYFPYVIGMNAAIGDEAAIEFSRGFYDALGAGEDIQLAYHSGCSAIELQGIPEHSTPILLGRYKIILDILEQINFAILNKVYIDCCPDGWLNRVPSKRSEIWHNLKDMLPSSENYSRVALFIVKLIKEVTSEVAIKLKEYAQTYIADFLDCLKNYRKISSTPKDTCLLVCIRRGIKPPKYFVSAYFITDVQNYTLKGGKTYQICRTLVEQKSMILEDIEPFVEQLYEKAGVCMDDYSKDFWIEFFVAPELLNKPIDCWKINRTNDCNLGCDRPVYIRSANRLSNKLKIRRSRWQEKWQMLQPQNLAGSKIIFASDYNSLNYLSAVLQQDESCVLIIDKSYSKQEYTKIISTVEDTGTPIVLWIRVNLDILNHQIEIKEVMQDIIWQIPKKVRQKRLEAFGCCDDDPDGKHIGNHLSLIWENPELYPIDYEFKYTSP